MTPTNTVFALTPAAPRPLTFGELGTLARMGFPEQAQRLALPSCPDCGGHPMGVLHMDACPGPHPEAAPMVAPQPWQPRTIGDRHAA